MKPITFIDTEIDPYSKKILDIGGVKTDGSTFHSNSIDEFAVFIKKSGFICGHNIIRHDLKYIPAALYSEFTNPIRIIDTLFLSPLLFPTRPYHNLLKDDKLQTDELNNPVNDSIKAKDLFFDEVTAFNGLDSQLKQIYYLLLHDQQEFTGFLDDLFPNVDLAIDVTLLIRKYFNGKICATSPIANIAEKRPIELAYCLALINSTDRYSITPRWVLANYPDVDRIMFLLRNKPCITSCVYCDQALDAKTGLKKYFGFDSYRTYGDEPLQEKAVVAALHNKSLLAIFPTGGGKSITFQVPALMAGENTKGLTVVISPLQSLMKDQVDNLEKIGITDSVTINGMLDPIERSNAFERVENGSAAILYISPESLRSRTIEHLLLGRKIERFVIDEAHCFSSWGQDFRVDYLYIADFIKSLQEKKCLTEKIPVSCFTATAKQKVIEDICLYFEEKLALNLKVFSTHATRTNLQYKVYNNKDEEDKYNKARMLIESKDCPAIIYVSRTKKAYDLATRLCQDGFNAKPYHGKMDIKEKTENQNAFIAGEVKIMVATSAFGMGVDKKDVGMVIHYEISNSLENYVQEAGRAGRDEKIDADCCVLFNEEDLNKHFILLNQTKLSVKEIQQVWRAIKDITKYRYTASNSALEIARAAGWDDNVMDIETRVKTAIAALEQAGYLKRGQNVPRIFANSILSKNAIEAIEKINGSCRFDKRQKTSAIRIIKKLFSTKSIKHANDEVAEARVDYISDHLGIVKEEVIKVITLLREEGILADTKDLTAFIKKDEKSNRSLTIVKTFTQLENFLLPLLDEEEKIIHLKEINESAAEQGCTGITPDKIKTILNFWAIKNWIKQKTLDYSRNHIAIICTQSIDSIKALQEKRHELSIFIINFLYDKIKFTSPDNTAPKHEVLIEFSVHELKEQYENRAELFNTDISIADIEDTLFYLSRIKALKVEGGFLVIYNKLTINRLEKNNSIRYKQEDYQQLDNFYQNKIQQIHIVGEYASKMLENYDKALRFINDYFQINYSSFLKKYFPGSRADDIRKNITPNKFRKLFGTLSLKQIEIINDRQTKTIVVAAGPGSGKTRVLVHKLASLYIMEDVKHEQLLMLTFSRAAATEFKKRLIDLIGNAANFIEIKTFHSYCFDLLGRVGSLEKSDKIIRETTSRIINGDVEVNKITKNVLVIDEAQDMNTDEFALIKALMNRNEEMRIIAVGDDDQNIYTFRGADSKYFEQFVEKKDATKYELIENYRSKKNLVDFTNQFAESIRHRFKSTKITPIQQDNGIIRIITHKSNNLIVPLVSDILSSSLSGSTAVLTKTNDEALQLAGLLLKNKIPAKLIQSNTGFDLFNIFEIRAFFDELKLDESTPTISSDSWNKAKLSFSKKHRNNQNFELCKTLIKDFETTNPKVKYKTDFVVFIKESKLEDFTSTNNDTIFVSTIHKAKGKEFNNVFLLLDNFNAHDDDKKRQLYVAMTRAKQNLTIHVNGNFLDNINVDEIMRINDDNTYDPPEQITIHLSHKDIQLSYFKFIQHRVNALKCGQTLAVSGNSLTNINNGETIVKFSQTFLTKKAHLEKTGYRLAIANVNFILYWKEKDHHKPTKEILIVLPELQFTKEKNI